MGDFRHSQWQKLYFAGQKQTEQAVYPRYKKDLKVKSRVKLKEKQLQTEGK